jgi:hypothetical protein
MKTIELDSLIGEHVLDAVDMFTEKGNTWDANLIKFRLDGMVYIAIENPDDGYRSMMKEIGVATNAKDRAMKNTFMKHLVLAKKKVAGAYGDDILELIDVSTKKVVLEVGTHNTDDYYPQFVSSFSPENLAINQRVKYEG